MTSGKVKAEPTEDPTTLAVRSGKMTIALLCSTDLGGIRVWLRNQISADTKFGMKKTVIRLTPLIPSRRQVANDCSELYYKFQEFMSGPEKPCLLQLTWLRGDNFRST